MSDWVLAFSDRLSYGKYNEIVVEIYLASTTSNRVAIDAMVDTGSKFCIFQRRYAEFLSLDLVTGERPRINTAAGSFTAYGHEVTLNVSDVEWETVVYFAEPENFPVNVVGRVGFLDHLRLGLVDYEQLLYISPYEVT